jgi:hypothetical protein
LPNGVWGREIYVPNAIRGLSLREGWIYTPEAAADRSEGHLSPQTRGDGTIGVRRVVDQIRFDPTDFLVGEEIADIRLPPVLFSFKKAFPLAGGVFHGRENGRLPFFVAFAAFLYKKGFSITGGTGRLNHSQYQKHGKDNQKISFVFHGFLSRRSRTWRFMVESFGV